MKLGLIKVSTMALAAMLVTGCASNRAHKGAVIDPQLASSIQPGTSRSTPTFGRKPSFFHELFGGIGSVNSIGAPGAGPPDQ